MKAYQLLFFLLIISSAASSQNSSWKLLVNSPVAGSSGRHDDLYFVNDSTGWLVNGDGEIWNTKNGGNLWTRQLLDLYYFRSVEFINDSVGFAGTLNGYLYQTINRGDTWSRIETRLPVPVQGICGMSHIGNTLWGVGVWSRPAQLIKTIDAGLTWTVLDMSAYASSLVDCWFLNKDVGFVSGRSQLGIEKALILRTADGGSTWTQVFTSQESGEYVWKLQFLNDTLGFGSIQSFGGFSSRIVKTTDGGLNWQEYEVTSNSVFLQGLAFMNDTMGWCGGWSNGMRETTDGGNSWIYKNLGMNFNRFFKVRDGLAYACGDRVYKYTSDTAGVIIPDSGIISNLPHGLSCNPNPATDKSEIKVTLDKDTYAILYIIDINGQHVEDYMEGFKSKGLYNFSVAKNKFSAGNYLLILQTNERYITLKIQVAD